MGLTFEERDHLRSTTRALLHRDGSSARVRSVIAEPPGYDADLWRQIVDLGWNAIHIAECHGGAGCGYAELGIVLHELGRAITPTPFLAAVLSTTALALGDNDAVAAELLPGLAAGERLGAVALGNVGGSYDLARLSCSWASSGRSIRVDGAAGFVLDADLAATLLVAARAEDGTIAAVAVDTDDAGVRIEATPTVDATRRLFRVAFDGVLVREDRFLAAPGAAASDLWDHVLSVGVVAAGLDAVGAAQVVLEEAATYATQRVQFGKPIGAFQAVKHHCADMAIAVQTGAAATSAAADALDGDPSGWRAAASTVASFVGPACAHACALGLLVHGGIGFTWEHDSHLLLKRVKLDEVLFGTPAWHRRRLADATFPSLVAAGARQAQPDNEERGR